MLSAAQRRSLWHLVAAERTPARVARRAQLVLDAAAEPQNTTLSRQARVWLDRYLDNGVRGLEDVDRPGRPSRISEDDRVQLLTEPLFIATSKWTSRTIATEIGISQSTVVRLWNRTYDPDILQSNGTWATHERLRRPTGLLLGHQSAVLMLARDRVPRHHEHRTDTDRAGTFSMRSRIRPPLQTILAAELLTRHTTDSDMALTEFLDAATPDADIDYLAVCRADSGADALDTVRSKADVVTVPVEHWQALLPHLGASLTPAALPILEELANGVREWAQDPRSAFCWTGPESAKTQSTRSNEPIPPSYLSESQRTAESVAAAIQDGVRTGRLHGGGRVTEPFLMRSTHASRSQVRDALRSLATDGLVDLRLGRGALVPMPTVDDVFETYSVRRALGHLIVGSAASWRSGDMRPVSTSFEDLLRTAARRDVWGTGEADLDFQDALAATVRLRRVPTMFRRMTTQLRLFISVMGLDYAYSIDEIVSDDSAIFEAVRRRDPTGAQDLWRRKMEAAVSYMVRQLKLRS